MILLKKTLDYMEREKEINIGKFDKTEEKSYYEDL